MAAGGQISGPGLSEVYTLVNLIVVGAIVYFGGRKTIAQSLKDRSEGIAKSIKESGQKLTWAKENLQKINFKLQNFELEKEKIFTSVEKEGQIMSKRIVDEAKLGAERMITEAKANAKNQARQAYLDLKKDLLDQSIELALKKAKQGDAKLIHQKLVEQFVSESAVL